LTVERIVYRVVERAGRGEPFLPPGGVGYGLGEGLGIVLNRVIKGPSKFQTSRDTIVGVVVAETADFVTIERADGRRFRIQISDVIERTVVA